MGAIVVTLRLETNSRWDALALARDLSRYHWYLIEPDAEHWDVYIRVDGQPSELPDDLLKRLQSWLKERNLPEATIQGADSTFSLTLSN